MKFDKLFCLQQALDDRILKEHNLTEPLLPKKILSLQVELGELANETRCFKFWSNTKPSNKDVILEEYVDCLHFILSIGIEKGHTNIDFDAFCQEEQLTNQFSNLFIDINDFITCSSKDHYVTLFEDFLTLGLSLNFTIEDIENGYILKNKTNHKRQDEGY